jgi:hypothetical protein
MANTFNNLKSRARELGFILVRTGYGKEIMLNRRCMINGKSRCIQDTAYYSDDLSDLLATMEIWANEPMPVFRLESDLI